MKLTQKEKETVMKKKLSYDKADLFLHCNNCLQVKPDGFLPGEWGQYQMTTHPFVYPSGLKADIWCYGARGVKCRYGIVDT
jgi:hypothetical protein